ncbi:MAG: O-methyltransferase [Clostridia bacterium]
MELSQLLLDMKSYATLNKVPIMLSDSAEVLVEMVKKHKPRRILEIGTAIGYSGILMLANSDAELFTIEIDEKSVEVAKSNFTKAGFIGRVTQWTGDAAEIVRYLNGKFDFVLLDGPKGHYSEFLPYIKDIMLLGGVLFSDNVLFKGYTYMEKPMHKHRTIINSLKNFLYDIESDVNFSSELLPYGDGISISIKK